MNPHVEALAKEIRSLPEEARFFLLDQLHDSLAASEVERAWDVELRRRIAEAESGRVVPLSDEQVMAELEAAARE